MAGAAQLPALTSLRFFAALAIVFHHIQGYLGVEMGFARPFLLEQGVSFFFVLSGFILSHVHGQLSSAKVGRFLWARAARIWPAHIAAIFVFIALRGWPDHGALAITFPAALANIGLLHAWFPWPSYYFSFNNVSWTLSVEVFFYATFPLVIRRIDRRWPFWLAVSLAAGYAMTEVGLRFEFPDSAHAPHAPDVLDVPDAPDGAVNAATALSFVQIHPLARWFEFVLGICGFVAWRAIGSRANYGRRLGTAVEVLAVAAVLWGSYEAAAMSSWLAANSAQFRWLADGPFVAPAFALLVGVLALERGALSRGLAHPLWVRLGEISYALYLVHYPFLAFALKKFPDAAAAASGAGLILLLSQMLLASHLLWQCVEAPARRALTRLFPMSADAPAVPLFPPAERRTLLATVVAHTLVLIALFAGQKWLEAG